jgi:hypothetical protein
VVYGLTHAKVIAHRRASLHQSVQIPSLIRAEERAIVRSIEGARSTPIIRTTM